MSLEDSDKSNSQNDVSDENFDLEGSPSKSSDFGASVLETEQGGHMAGQYMPANWRDIFTTEYLFGGTWDAFLGRNLPQKTRLGNEENDGNLVFNRGPGTFFRSLGHFARKIFTIRFLICLFAGQVISVALTGTNVLTTELGNNNWNLPASQTFFLYLILLIVYLPTTLYKYGIRAYLKMLLTDGWKYLFLAAVDVEGNFLVVKAYQYTTLLSCELLDAWAVPSCMVISYFLVRNRYHWSQILGVLVAVGGLALLVASDLLTDKDYSAPNPGLGDGFMVIGATLYGLSNSLEEFFVKSRPLYEVLGQMGLWGVLINGGQGAGLEWDQYKQMTWNGDTAGYLVGYTLCMLVLYTLAPILFRLSSSPFYNISILTSDFYGLCFGLRLFHYSPYWLYFVAYAVVLVGLVIYFSFVRPEETQNFSIESRGRQKRREEERGDTFVIGK